MATVVLVGTFDTKGGEFAFARDKILSLGTGAKVLLVDVSIRSTKDTIPQGDIGSSEIVAAAGGDYEKLHTLSKFEAIGLMSRGVTHILLDLYKNGKLHGVLGMGGGCGSSMLSTPFQQLPIGVPKLLISAVIATGSARPYIGCTDMTIMFSVTDFSGKINQVNRQIVSNAAVAIAAMAVDYAKNGMDTFTPSKINSPMKRVKPLIVAGMIGITQPCVLIAQAELEKLGYDVITFSCAGAGGEAMENLIASGVVDGVLDTTLNEVMHHTVPGGILNAGPHRLEAAGRLGVPQVVALGALDILTFGPYSAIPTEYRGRLTFENNVNFINVRTSQEECTNVGKIIADKLNQSHGPVILFVPLRGTSLVSVAGKVLADPAADACLFQSVRTHIDPKVVRLIERDEHINEPQFALALVDAMHEQLKHKLSTIDDNN